MQNEIAAKRIKPIEPSQFMINLMAMVVFPFIAKAIININLDIDGMEYDWLIEKRKTQIPEFIFNSIQIKN